MKKKVTFYAVFIWFLAILFYFYEFSMAMMPATISGNIINDMQISAEQFAMMGSAFFLTYSLMQLPVGIIYDRYGVRLFLTLACGVCTLGLFGFANADNFYSGVLSRLLIGFGSSFGFISLLILALNWFPRKYFGFLAGLGQMLGAVGPLLAGAPVAYLMVKVDNDWRMIFSHIAYFGAALTVLIALFVRTKPKSSQDDVVYLTKEAPLSKKLKQLLRIPQIWLTMLYAGAVYLSMPLLGAYWGTLYLQTRGFSKASSALMISMIWVGMALSCPIMGRLSDLVRRRKPFLLGSSFLGVVISLAILLLPVENLWVLSILFVTLGMASGGQSLSFATISDIAPEELRATAIGANNSMVNFFGAIFPPLVTWIMQEHKTEQIYTQADFTFGFFVMPIAYGIAFLIALIGIRETFCRAQQTVHYIG